MRLIATGTEQRRSLVLVLHDAAEPATMLTDNWQPKGLCNAASSR
jgi:hypothetical protein